MGSTARQPGPAGAAFAVDRTLLAAILLAVAVRVLVFAAAALWPVANEQGRLISPLFAVSGIDLAHYQGMRALYFGAPGEALAALGSVFGGTSLVEWGRSMFAGPALPLLLEVFDYRPGNTLPLALFYLVLASALAVAWLVWLRAQGAGPAALAAFALLPNPLWFMLNVSTDLPFAAATAAFYFVFFAGPLGPRRLAACAALVLLALTIRPNGVALGLFLAVQAALALDRRRHGALLAALALVLAAGAAFYGPYLYSFVTTSTDKPLYFGLPQAAFLDGVFPWLPGFADRALSLLALVGAKLLCLVGLRPSAGDAALPFVLLRAAPGLILLPGLLWGLLRADRAHRLLLLIFIAPVLAGATQDRYMLPLLPVLFWFGWRAWAAGFERLRAWTPAPRAASAADRGDD